MRNLWRLYGGWYEGNPAQLKPAPERELARELAALAGGAERLAERALASSAGEASCGWRATWPSSPRRRPRTEAAQEARAEVNERRAGEEASTMARGVFSWAAAESRRARGGGG